MKKWFLALIILLVLGIVSIYLFIPSTLSVSSVRVLNCTANGSFRSISDKNKWAEWFPQSVDAGNYTPDKVLMNTVHVSIQQNGENIPSIIQLLPFATDSTAIQWQTTFATGNNPFNRIQRYRKAVAIKKDMDEILDRLRSFVQDEKNIYGFSIERTTFRDTLLLATKTSLNAYPTTEAIYLQVNSIKARIAQQNATQTGYPMVNTTRLDSNHYQLMVALPVNRVLEDHQPFFFRRMIPGAFMTAEIKGGSSTVKEALYQMQVYFNDHRKTSMAIPFENHITDRQAEPDSAKWVTRIYAPVF